MFPFCFLVRRAARLEVDRQRQERLVALARGPDRNNRHVYRIPRIPVAHNAEIVLPQIYRDPAFNLAQADIHEPLEEALDNVVQAQAPAMDAVAPNAYDLPTSGSSEEEGSVPLQPVRFA